MKRFLPFALLGSLVLVSGVSSQTYEIVDTISTQTLTNKTIAAPCTIDPTCTIGGGGAPANATYLTGSANGTLTNAIVVTPTDDTTIVGNGTTWQVKALTDCQGAGKAVTYTASTNTWGCNTISGGTPGGSNTQVQFNNSGAFGGDSGLTWNTTNKTLTVDSAGSSANPLEVRTGASNPIFRVVNTGTSMVNFLTVTGATTGSRPVLNFTGTDSTVHGEIAAQGSSGQLRFTAPGGSIFSGNVDPSGGDTNILGFSSQWQSGLFTRAVGVGNFVSGFENGIFLNAKPTGTNPTITAESSASSNVNVNIVPKGTGTLQQNAVDVATISGTQTLTNKTLTTPAIGSFTNATHTHQNAAGGGTLDAAAIAAGTMVTARLGSGTANSSTFLRGDSTWASTGGGSGDVVGPGAATDNAICRFDSTTGKLIQNSTGIIDDSGNLSGIAASLITGQATFGSAPDASLSVQINRTGFEGGIQFEGPTADAFETNFGATDPTGGDQSYSLPNAGASKIDTLVASTLAQSLTNKTFDNTNTVTLKDTLFTLQDDGDTTKQAKFQASGIATATTRTYTLFDSNDTLAGLAATQTLTNKTLTTPTIGDFTNATHTHLNNAGGGTLTAAAVTDLNSATVTFTNKTLDVEATGNVITTVSKVWLGAAGCNNATASTFYDLPTSNAATPACVTGTNIQKGVLQYADSANQFGQYTMFLPADWTGAVDARVIFTSADVTNAHTEKWTVATACRTPTGGSGSTDDPTFNTANTLTYTNGASEVANALRTVNSTGITTTGCNAGDVLHLKFGRDTTDTDTGTMSLVGWQMTLRRAQ